VDAEAAMKSTNAADDILTADTRAKIAAAIRASGARIGADRVMLVALVMALHADADGKAYPSRTTLESLTGIPARLVRQAIDVLEAAEVIYVIREPGRHNVYRFPALAGIPASEPGREPGRDPDQTRQGTWQGTGQGSLPQREVKFEGEGQRSKFCTKHPNGTDDPCRGCKAARESFEAWEAARLAEQEANAKCKHGRLRGDWLDPDGVSLGGCLQCERETGCLSDAPQATSRNLRSVVSSIGRAV
jgi:hypothetical protein